PRRRRERPHAPPHGTPPVGLQRLRPRSRRAASGRGRLRLGSRPLHVPSHSAAHAPPPLGAVSLADGGLLSNYPIGVFDQPDGETARWPAIGLRLSAREDEPSVPTPVGGLFGVTRALVTTVLHGIDRRHIDEPDTVARTLFIDTAGVSSMDFDLSPA